MTTYPLPTLAATVTPAGITAPNIQDIIASLEATVKSIYGNDIYIDPDSQDGQLLATFAAAINDSNAVAISVYNSFSPAKAIGVGLSSVVKINGLTRDVATNSTADVRIVGQAGTLISGGIVLDTNNNRWMMTTDVEIPLSGEIVVTVVAEQQGDIIAAAGAINRIGTPTRGWQTVYNEAPATPGAPVEDDAELRVRQSQSTQLPSLTINGGIVGGIANLTGVIAQRLYENDTKVTDANGIPGNTISLVVLGGDANQIAQMIALKKTPGTGTYGTTSELIVDDVGVPNTIRFFRPGIVQIDVNITIQPRPGYVSTTGQLIKNSIVAGNNAQGIGGDIYIAKQFTYANLVGTGLEDTFNVTSITMRRDANAYAAADIPIAFNELAQQLIGNINLTVA